jgi:putative tryptophan/tyrosine transport system substrate-binding protein
MRHRAFFALVCKAALWSSAAGAQPAAMPIIGFLNPGSPVEAVSRAGAFVKGLNESGYVDGRNVEIDYRWGHGRYDQLPALAADLVRRRVSVIATAGGDPPTFAAKAATTTIPIVFLIGRDPVDAGLVSNLGRPEGNLTGISVFTFVLTAKRQELMREMTPSNALIAMLVNPTNGSTSSDLANAQVATGGTGQKIRVLNASTDREIDAAIETVVQERLGGLIVQGDSFFTNRREQLVLLTTRHAIPAIFAWREFAESGGLMSYGTNLRVAYRQAGGYVARILKGSKPADLPVQQASVFELVVNLRAAKALGLTIPTAILLRADEVIE